MRPTPFVIAEAGVNHNGRLALALRLVDAAAAAGADAVKFQTFKAERLATPSARKARYQEGTAGGPSGQLEMLRRLELSEREHREVVRRCRARGIIFMSSPFDEGSADFLAGLGMSVFKIPSGEVTNLLLLRHLGRKRRPVILSTGMSTLAEVREAVRTLRSAGTRDITLLHCVSSYPTPVDQANLAAMRTLSQAFRLPVGYSDHTEGITVPIAAAALGAAAIEKHFTLDKALPGPDHRMSLDPDELRAMVRGVRDAAASLGDGTKAPRPCERDVLQAARRSLVLARDARAGERLTDAMLCAKRPGTGIAPTMIRRVLGRFLKRRTRADTVLTWGMLR